MNKEQINEIIKALKGKVLSISENIAFVYDNRGHIRATVFLKEKEKYGCGYNITILRGA